MAQGRAQGAGSGREEKGGESRGREEKGGEGGREWKGGEGGRKGAGGEGKGSCAYTLHEIRVANLNTRRCTHDAARRHNALHLDLPLRCAAERKGSLSEFFLASFRSQGEAEVEARAWNCARDRFQATRTLRSTSGNFGLPWNGE